MKKKLLTVAALATLAALCPLRSHAEGVADELHSLQGMLSQLYDQMIPLCSDMIGVARAIGGFAALWYIAARVWKHLAAAEPVDYYPLLRPFAIGFCVAFFPLVLRLMNGVLQPVVTATENMVTNSNQAIGQMLSEQPQADNEQTPDELNSDPDKWYVRP